MNLLEELHDELKNSHFNEIEKIRYIYLRTCCKFSFDERYFHSEFYYRGLKRELENMIINPHNINSFITVCHPYNRLVKTLIDELTLSTAIIKGEKHSRLECGKWSLDATTGDFSRVKMHLKTYGFVNLDGENEKLSEIDDSLGYIPYSKDSYLNSIDISTIPNMYESVSQLLKNSKCQKEFSDAQYFIHYLLYGIGFYSLNEEISKDENGLLVKTFETNDISYELKKEKVYSLKRLDS